MNRLIPRSSRFLTLGIFLGMVSALSIVRFDGAPARVTGQQEETPQDGEEALGLDLVETACVQCHGLYPVFSQRKSEESWRQTVDMMVWRGAQMKPGEADSITAYLAAVRAMEEGSDSAAERLSEIAQGDFPNGDRGRKLVLDRCVSCHDLSLITLQRKTVDGWKESVQRMVRMGTPLSPDEVVVVVEYLTGRYGAATSR